MEVLGLLSAAGVPTQGLLPSSAGATAEEFAAVLDGLDLQPAEPIEDVADAAQSEEEVGESDDAEVSAILVSGTVPAPAAALTPAVGLDSSPPESSIPATPVAEVEAESIQTRSAAPQLVPVTTEDVAGISARAEVAPDAVVPDTPVQEKPDERQLHEPATKRAPVAMPSGVIPSQQAAAQVISATSGPETHAAIRESQSLDPPNRLELPDLANFTVTVHESRLSSTVPDSHATTRAQPAPDARHVLQQIGDNLTDRAEGAVEIALSPEELGKVRLVITSGDKPAVTVHADRPETYDLLRRNAEALDKELRSAGIFGADISFSGGNDRPGNRNQAVLATSRSTGPRDHILNFAEQTTPPKAHSVVDRRIDIRI